MRCYKLTYVPSKFISWSPNSQCDYIWKQAFSGGKVKETHKGEALIQHDLHSSKKKERHRIQTLRGQAMGGPSEQTVISKARRGASEEIKPAESLRLDFQSPGLWGNTFLSSKKFTTQSMVFCYCNPRSLIYLY